MPRRGENIRKRKDGRWEGRYKVKKDIGNKKECKYKSVYGKTYTEVKEKLHQCIILAENTKTESFNKNITVDIIAQQWLEHIHLYKKYSTYIKYLSIYEKHIKQHIGNKNVDDLKQEDCFELLKYEILYGVNGKKEELEEREQYGISKGISQGEERKLIELMRKKLAKGKDLKQIADELEETEEVILPLYTRLKEELNL